MVPIAPRCSPTWERNIIKIETPNSDNGRWLGRPARTPGMGALHMTINRGKRSVNWNLKTEEGRARLRRLIAGSDVFIHNVRSEAIRRLGFDYESVRAFAPDIIYVHCSGFDSERAGWRGCPPMTT